MPSGAWFIHGAVPYVCTYVDIVRPMSLELGGPELSEANAQASVAILSHGGFGLLAPDAYSKPTPGTVTRQVSQRLVKHSHPWLFSCST